LGNFSKVDMVACNKGVINTLPLSPSPMSGDCFGQWDVKSTFAIGFLPLAWNDTHIHTQPAGFRLTMGQRTTKQNCLN
jgi:hypothetical protein